MKVLFTGGGTGGHVFPIIAVKRELQKLSQEELKFYYLGPKDDFTAAFFPQEGIKNIFILSGKIRRYWNFVTFFQNLFDIIIKIPLGIIESFIVLFFLAPDIVFSKGGYGSIPAVISAWILRIPIFLHESDVSPGLANKILSNFSKEVFISFPPRETEYFPLNKMIYVGNPIRKELLNGDEKRAKEIFSLQGNKPLILILGGSQGSERINEIILNVLPELIKDFEVIHQVGDKNLQKVKIEAQAFLSEDLLKYYHFYSFLKEDELKHALKVANLAIARAGSGTIFEIAAAGIPSILIPLPESAQNHQVKNAYAYAKSGACIVLEEGNLTPYFFLQNIKNLFAFQPELNKMAQAAKEFSKPEAAKIIANYLIEY